MAACVPLMALGIGGECLGSGVSWIWDVRRRPGLDTMFVEYFFPALVNLAATLDCAVRQMRCRSSRMPA